MDSDIDFDSDIGFDIDIDFDQDKLGIGIDMGQHSFECWKYQYFDLN